MISKSLRVLLLTTLLSSALWAQHNLTGTIKSDVGEPLVGVNIQEKGTRNGSISNTEGKFSLRVSSGDAVLIITYIGYERQEISVSGQTEINIAMKGSALQFGETQVVGTRSYNRSVASTPVPVDVIDMRDTPSKIGIPDMNQLMQIVVPSFNSTKQSGADGADHIDPASLRGLGPDQTLVLINGKRRHQSSLINIFGTRGRGNTGTDLNTIPAAAIERVEILRDGASAQYGSDAIAGVMNIVLKKSVGEFTGSVSQGFNNADPGIKSIKADKTLDGATTNLNANYGVALGKEGFVNFTTDFVTHGRTNRFTNPKKWPDNYRTQFGDASSNNLILFANSAYPISKTTSVYAFAGLGYRATDAFAYTREAGSERNVVDIYPNGFNPHITSVINDYSLSAGVRTKLSGWDVDVNNTVGTNKFSYTIKKTLNATLLAASPTSFDAGGFQLTQNTTGINFSKFFPSIRNGLNMAFGSEFRIDNYQIFAGEAGSYKTYGKVVFSIDGADTTFRPGGSQGFPGFQPSNELSKNRTNTGAYADAELDITDKWLVATAARFEHYSDFGSTVTGKFASRYKVLPDLVIRGSASTGFRAPSLAQIYFNSTFTDFAAGVAIDKVVDRNGGPIAKALGIPKLKEEQAIDLSGGITYSLGEFSFSADGYLVNIKDRIVLTGGFADDDPDIAADLQALNVGAAQFFTNAIDTKTQGIDLVAGWATHFGSHKFQTTFAANFNKMSVSDVHTNKKLAGKEDIYFGRREKLFLLASAPGKKANLTFDDKVGKFGANLQFVYYSFVKLEDFSANTDYYKQRIVTNLTCSYELTKNLVLYAGAANLLNTYPTHQNPADSETGGVWDAVQMGFSGAMYFTKLNYRF